MKFDNRIKQNPLRLVSSSWLVKAFKANKQMMSYELRLKTNAKQATAKEVKHVN